MTLIPITITNPGAELGNTSGWTAEAGPGLNVNTTSPHSGTYRFGCNGSLNDLVNKWYQTVNIDPSEYANVDAELYTINASCWHISGSVDQARFYVEFRDASNVVITTRSYNGGYASHVAWTQLTITSVAVPPLTRKIRIGVDTTASTGDGIGNSNSFDDFELNFDDTMAVNIKEYAAGVYALGTYPSEEARATAVGAMTVAGAETSSGEYEVRAHQVGLYALVRSFPDRRDLNAWTFVQDDHIFYVLNLGNIETIVYDKLSKQWSTWKSPEYAYWRPSDGVEWAGMTVSCDRRSNKIFEVDANDRLEYGTTVIISKATGMVPARMRQVLPCYAAELVVSQAQPAGPLDTVNSINLRFSDDAYVNFVDMGSVDGEPFGESTLFRWYGLGQIDAPGRMFEIVNNGYARRIDSLDISVGGEGE